jgi:ATP-binding cassette subfamily B protein
MKSLTQQTLNIYWKHAKKYPWHVFGIVFGMVAHAALHNYNPIVFKKIVDQLPFINKAHIEPVITLIFVMLFVSLFRMACARGLNFLNNYFQPRVMADLSDTCFKYLQQHSYSFFNGSFVGSLVTRVKRYERSFEQISDQIFFDLGKTFVESVIILGIIIYHNRTIGMVTLVWMVLYLIFSYFYALYKMPHDLKRAQADTRVTAQLADSITNNVNIKTFSNYTLEEEKFKQTTYQQFRLRKKSWDLGTIGDIVQALSMIFVHTLVVYLAIRFWQQDLMTVGTIVLIETYWFRMSDKLWNVGKNIRTIYEAIADANEMTEILLKPHEIKDREGAKILRVKEGKIEFKNVGFSYYEGTQVLRNFNLGIKPKERVALIGPSGGGKSTIVKLLLRFHDIQSGGILIDGQDVSTSTQDSLRDSMALVPQDPILFHRTLMENIRYSRPSATDEEVIAAAKAAHAHEFISASQHGYETFVGERGIKLSGGQRQRVAIARAILKNAPILVLDEATSSLDSESESYIQDALKILMKDKTVIVIAHRLSTIMQMDRIIVLENGKVTEEGKHAELVKAKKGTYQKLWQIQAGGFA